MHLFADRGFSAGLVTQATFQGAMAGFALITLTIYVQLGLGFSAIRAGLTLLPFSLGAFVGTAIAVPLGVKVGKLIMVVGGAVQSVAVLWTMAEIRAHGDALSIAHVVAAAALAGIGLGLLVVPLIDIALATVPTSTPEPPRARTGPCSRWVRRWGSPWPAWCSSAWSGTTYTPQSLRDGMLAAGWVPVAGYALAALASLLLPGRAEVLAHVEQQARELELAA